MLPREGLAARGARSITRTRRSYNYFAGLRVDNSCGLCGNRDLKTKAKDVIWRMRRSERYHTGFTFVWTKITAQRPKHSPTVQRNSLTPNIKHSGGINEELLDIRQSALSICDYLRESEKDYCRAAGMLVAICALSDTEESSLPTTNSVLTCASHRKARGLTILIVPILRIRRKRTIQLVLQAQADMRDQILSDSMLAAKYHYWSRYATAWARVLAEQDTAGCCE
jgi:protein tyrosine phosphatase (PTP) superfamily phosphohydrolase (DUF442 family)